MFGANRKVSFDKDGTPTTMPCPVPSELIDGYYYLGNQGCVLGWAGYAMAGNAMLGRSSEAAANLAIAVMGRCGLKGLKVVSSSDDTWDSDVAVVFNAKMWTDPKFPLRFCKAWRAEAEARGYDTSNQPKLPR